MRPSYRCYDPRCSLACRRRWARREAEVTRSLAGGLGADWTITIGTLAVHTDQPHEEVVQTRARFLDGLRRWCQERGVRHQLLCVCEVGLTGRPHDHFVLATTRPIPQPALRRLYAAAARTGRETKVVQAPREVMAWISHI